MNIVPLIVIGALLVVMLVLSNRNKAKRSAADAARRKEMVVGTRVMTTSGMYGTITAVDPGNTGAQSDTITLEIAPGVEVEWALAAVREAPTKAEPMTAPQAAIAADNSTGSAPTPGSTVIGSAANGDLVASQADSSDDVTAVNGAGPVRLGKPKGRTAAQN